MSTRGEAPPLGFEDAMLAGLARDGGLYVPETWPRQSPADMAALKGLPYAEAAARIMVPFMAGAITKQELLEITGAAYATFEHGDVAPLVEIGEGRWLLELFHGPTLSFKDIAMQVLSRLMERALTRRRARATIVGATSGDTGSAAIHAFRGCSAIDIFILHPEGRVSDVQRRQMTAVEEANVHNIAIRGTFDDCQALVKAMFNDLALRDRLSLAGVNSINWARIMAQTVYYFTAAAALDASEGGLCYSVPTGNFGDIFAGYVAHRMGLPVRRLVIATNINDILARTLESGRYEPKGVVATSSPSMDIQVSSNFERLMFEAAGREGSRVTALMQDLARSGAFELSKDELAAVRRLFAAVRVDEVEAGRTIATLHERTGYLADPHTAVGIAAAEKALDRNTQVVTLATAHPAKFPEAVNNACGRTPEVPARLEAQLGAKERFTVLPNDFAEVAGFVEAHARAAAGAIP